MCCLVELLLACGVAGPGACSTWNIAVAGSWCGWIGMVGTGPEKGKWSSVVWRGSLEGRVLASSLSKAWWSLEQMLSHQVTTCESGLGSLAVQEGGLQYYRLPRKRYALSVR